MTQKERLVELLKKTPNADLFLDYDEFIDVTADILLSDGVFVPPCKVGDEVYCVALRSIDPFIKQETVERIQYTEQGFYYGMQKGIYFENEVFLTREAAEQALKELETG